MPTFGFSGPLWAGDPQKWERCRREAGAQMIAEGWSKHAGKFYEVQTRRALKIWRNK